MVLSIIPVIASPGDPFLSWQIVFRFVLFTWFFLDWARIRLELVRAGQLSFLLVILSALSSGLAGIDEANQEGFRFFNILSFHASWPSQALGHRPSAWAYHLVLFSRVWAEAPRVSPFHFPSMGRGVFTHHPRSSTSKYTEVIYVAPRKEPKWKGT